MATTTPPRQRLTRAQMRVMRKQFPGYAVPQYVAPVSLKWRLVKATARGTWWLRKKGWTRRRPLAPLYAAVLLFTLGVVAHHDPNGWRSITAGTVVAAAAIVGWQWRARRRPRDRRVLTRIEWSYVVSVWAAATWWLMLAAFRGVGGTWAVLVILLGIAWVPIGWRYMIRHHEKDGPLPELAQLWEDYAAVSGGLAPGSKMQEVEPLDQADPQLATTGIVELPRHSRIRASSLIAETERIAMVYDREVENIALERVQGRSPRFVRVTRFNRNPLMDRVWWAGPDAVFDPATGSAEIARYVTGGTAKYRFYKPSGPVHDLIAGTTDSGKSAFINGLLAIERAHPYIASVIIDPQEGQSLPRWKKSTAVFACGLDEGRDVLHAVRQEMYRRNRVLSSVEWRDERTGRTYDGVDAFDINSQIIRDLNMPMISVTLEESGDALKDKSILDDAVAISTMARKCGIRLRLVAQTPLLEQMQSSLLRSMLIGGNVVVFRTADPLQGQVAIGSVLPADPASLPREWEDGSTTAGLCYVLGPQAKPVVARTWPIEDVYHWATVGETTTLPELERGLQTPREIEPVSVPAQRGRETAGDRIVAFLEKHEMSTTGIISERLEMPMSTVSTTCRRLADAGRIDDLGRAKWGRLVERTEVAA